MVMQWGQFLDHDLTLTPESEEHGGCCSAGGFPPTSNCFPIHFPDKDPVFGNLQRERGVCTRVMELTRSVAFCTSGRRRQREQMNGITAFVDASNVYGSDEETAHKLRTFSNGQMKTSAGDLLPKLPNDDGVEEFTAGDVRVNENSGLAALHTVFVREHNAIAMRAAELHPDKSDEMIYQFARRLVGAQIQNIVYGQWLPEILGPNNMGDLSLDEPSNYDSSMDPSITNEFATAAFRFGHSMVEDFVQLREVITNKVKDRYRLKDNFFNSTVYEEAITLVLNGMVNQRAQSNDRHVVADVRDFLFRNVEHPGSDLIARNIHRGRDHGLPGYNDYLELRGRTRACSWDDPPEDIPRRLWKKLAKLYDEPSDVDLFTAGLAERRMPGAHVGPTFGWIIKKQFRVINL